MAVSWKHSGESKEKQGKHQKFAGEEEAMSKDLKQRSQAKISGEQMSKILLHLAPMKGETSNTNSGVFIHVCSQHGVSSQE